MDGYHDEEEQSWHDEDGDDDERQEISLPLAARPRRREGCCYSVYLVLTRTVVAIGLVGLGVVAGWWLAQESPLFSINTVNPWRRSDPILCYHPVVDIFYDASSTIPSDISRRREKDDMLQGIAWLPPDRDGTHVLYMGHTRTLYKIQLDPDDLHVVQILNEKTYNQTTEFPTIRLANGQDLPIAHFGGIAAISTPQRGPEILLAAHTALDEDGSAGGSVVGVNAETLEFNNGTVVAHNPTTASDWVTVDYAAGIGYAGAFYNVTRALRFSIDTLKDLEPLYFTGSGLPDSGINFVQSATILGSTLLLGTDNYQGSLYHVDKMTGRVQGVQSLLLGNEMDGVASVGPNQLLVGYNRWKAREAGFLQSIVLFEATHEWIRPDTTTACGGSYVRFLD